MRADGDLNYDWFWFVTWTTYGSFVPGDQRGATGILRDHDRSILEHNQLGQDHIPELKPLEDWSRQRMRGSEVRLNLEQARVLLTQLQCTASHLSWRLLAVAIMDNHIHLCVNVHSDPDPEDILGRFKSYGSRALNLQWDKPKSGKWWTQSGSKRKLDSENSVTAAIEYITNQRSPLILWTYERGIIVPKP